MTNFKLSRRKLLGTAAAASAVLAAPAILRSRPARAAGVVNIWTYDGFVPDDFKTQFEKDTGIEVRMQESKSQHQNRAKAWQLLRTRLHAHQQQQKDAERAQQRSAMIGSGGRSERVRTYRYKENLVVESTDAGAKPDFESVTSKLPYESPSLNSYRDMSDLLALDPPMPGLQQIPWDNQSAA